MKNGTAPYKKQKINIIIAREGLIILSVLLLSGAVFLIDLWLHNQKKTYESNVQEIEPVIVEKDKEHGGKLLTPQGVILQFAKGTTDEIIKQTIRRDFPNIQGDDWMVLNSPEGKNIAASYDTKGSRIFDSIIYKINFSYVYIFFLIFAYPLYLLIRFTIWAIVTLK